LGNHIVPSVCVRKPLRNGVDDEGAPEGAARQDVDHSICENTLRRQPAANDRQDCERHRYENSKTCTKRLLRRAHATDHEEHQTEPQPNQWNAIQAVGGSCFGHAHVYFTGFQWKVREVSPTK
jgi:hypothetical protein